MQTGGQDNQRNTNHCLILWRFFGIIAKHGRFAHVLSDAGVRSQKHGGAAIRTGECEGPIARRRVCAGGTMYALCGEKRHVVLQFDEDSDCSIRPREAPYGGSI